MEQGIPEPLWLGLAPCEVTGGSVFPPRQQRGLAEIPVPRRGRGPTATSSSPSHDIIASPASTRTSFGDQGRATLSAIERMTETWPWP